MNGGYMDRYDTIVGIIIMVLMILGLVFFAKHEENKYSECKYTVYDSHKFMYHAKSYKVIDGRCINIINEENKTVVVCGQYTIEQNN